MDEIFKVKRHPTKSDLWVTEDGRVLKELFPSKDCFGYHLIRCGKTKERRHVIVAETYHGCRPLNHVVRHKDGCAGNDHYDNLEWGTQLQNCNDTIAHGNTTRGSKNRHAVLTELQVLDIKTRLHYGEGITTLAKEYSVSKPTIYDIKAERTWKHIQLT